jgi:metallo-beta-lactamase family protein
MLTLAPLGAAGTVTGSKHLLTCDGHHILIDCGLFQGLKNLRELNWEKLPVQPHAIDAVILTHAHLDYCGYLPPLVRDGFRGRIYATEATRDVTELILMDSAFLKEKDAEFLNRHHLSKHNPKGDHSEPVSEDHYRCVRHGNGRARAAPSEGVRPRPEMHKLALGVPVSWYARTHAATGREGS